MGVVAAAVAAAAAAAAVPAAAVAVAVAAAAVVAVAVVVLADCSFTVRSAASECMQPWRDLQTSTQSLIRVWGIPEG